MQKKNKKKKMI